MRNSIFLIIAGITMILAVVIGAFGAHGLAPYMNEEGKIIFQTGSKYHFFHGLALWIIYLLSIYFKTDKFKLAFWLLALGIVFFSGSLYLLAVKAHLPTVMIHILGPVTPLGGLLFIIGWMVLTYRAIRLSKSQ